MDVPTAKRKFMTPKNYMIGAGVVIVLLAAAAGFFFWKYVSVKNDDPTSAAEEKSQRVTDKVGMLYQLPVGEEPTVAQVQDKNKLSKQEFFDKAENGDYILVYKKARLAIIYRESIDKLINVGPISLDQQQSDGQTAGEATEVKN